VGKLTEVLLQHSLIGIDTSAFIYQLEDSATYAGVSNEALDALAQGVFQGVTSILTLMEVTVRPFNWAVLMWPTSTRCSSGRIPTSPSLHSTARPFAGPLNYVPATVFAQRMLYKLQPALSTARLRSLPTTRACAE
jgi:hypothetical protein